MIELGHIGFDPGFEQPSLRAARNTFQIQNAQSGSGRTSTPPFGSSAVQCYPAKIKTFHEKSRLLIYDSLLSHTHIVRKLTFLGVQKCRCVTIGYPRNKVIQSQSLKNGSILYEDSELRNEVTVSFPIEGIFQNIFAF